MSKSKLQLILSMVIFGSIGIFVKYINLPSEIIAMIRGLIGSVILIIIGTLTGRKIDFPAIKKNLPILLISGTAMGFNWILLFEAYRYIDVSLATLCYYLAPVFVIIASPFVVKEKTNAVKVAATFISLGGMVLVSGVLNVEQTVNYTGILLGIGAAILYATVMLMSKFLKDISSDDSTIVRLGVAGIAVGIYSAFTQDILSLRPDIVSVILVLFVAVVHTGITYKMYFSAMGELPTQTVAIYSYIDPVVSIILSIVILSESFGVIELIGSVMILGSTLACELWGNK
ncbi:MAG: DMT family transporter [Anaerofustis stercorihominis]|nr:DMT family transporter [Anaerofustis stercorihominis]